MIDIDQSERSLASTPILRYKAQIGVPAAVQKTISWNTFTSIRMEAGYIGPTLCQKVSGDLLTC